MSELCNNSACFSVEIKGTSDICVTFVVYACGNSACFFVEIKGTSDIYSSSKSLMIILPFMEEAICYCNNAKLTIESFSYLGQLNNYITLLIQPVRKFFRAGRSCFYSLFSL